MSRASFRRRRILAIGSLLALLFSQWTMALHFCASDEFALATQSAGTAAPADCHHPHPESPAPDVQSDGDVWCSLHCAQPDEASAPNKTPVPGAMLDAHAGPLVVPLALPQNHLLSHQDDAPPRDARRRLIEHGALLI